jgi:hypothetical protein
MACLANAAENPDKLTQAAKLPAWRNLIHFSRFLPWSGLRGEVDGDGFYLSPEGRDNPLAELKQTIAALQSNEIVGKMKQPARCGFPERLRFVNQELGLSIPAPKHGDCEAYDHLIGQMNAQGVSLVFSSAYASNPGSMFGHTFLKIATGRKSDLLDKGISFAASVPAGEGGLIFVVLGLVGGYAGQYSFQSYHEKVQEYVNSESRDLWEYTLNFTPEESQRLVNHLWEIESNSWYDYYFTNKNCSYQLLTAIEVVKPDWDISSNWLWVVPAETVKRVMEIPGAVTQVRYRPSLRRKMMQSLDKLTPEEKSEYQNLIDFKVPAAEISSPKVLSSAIEYIQYHRAESVGVDRQDLGKLWDEVLDRRSELGPVAPTSAYQEPPVDHPEMGHGPTRIGLGQGFANSQGAPLSAAYGFQELFLKPAYHDLLNNDRGYPPFSEIDFPNLTLRYYPSLSRFTLERLQLMGMVSLVPLDFLEKRWSWQVDLEIENPKDLDCDGCHVFHAEIEWGASIRLLSDHFLLYGLAGAYVDAGSGLVRSYRLGPGTEAGLLWNPVQLYKLRFRGRGNGDVFQYSRPPIFGSVGFDQSFGWNAHWETRLEALKVLTAGAEEKSVPSYLEAKLSLQYYF